MEVQEGQVGQEGQGGQQEQAVEPRRAASAEPHKRRAVAAVTVAGEADGTWTTVLPRRARRQERAQPGVTSGSAARKAAAARAAAARRTAAAILDHVGAGGE